MRQPSVFLKPVALAAAVAAIFAILVAPASEAAPKGEGGLPAFTAIDPPRAAPDVELATRDGEAITLGALEGKVVLVNLWATWCPPCVAEMPSLDRLAEAMDGEDVAVVAVSADRGGEKVVGPFVEEHGLEHLTIWLDTGMTLPRAVEARGLPATFLIDRQGQMREIFMGPAEWDTPEVEAWLAEWAARE